jgi:NADH-quinone oxidoreductase subunit M
MNFETWKVNKSIKGYFSLFLLLETGMLGVFVALDFFLFYIFWEVMLLPMYFLIGVWGSPPSEAGRGGPYAAIKFFIYTLFGSVLMLVALLGFYFYSAGASLDGKGTFDLIKLATDENIQNAFKNGTFLGYPFASVMFIFLAIGFAVKVPSFPFHTWLPDAHVEAPTPISMILAGVLLKMGAYGFLRIAYPILPGAAAQFAWLIAAIGVISILYGALCAMAQKDFKKLVAYSSISHMGYVMLGIAVMNDTGFQGAMFQVIAHGVSSPMCFFLVGVIYDRAHHRWIQYPDDPAVFVDKAGKLGFGGLWLTMPVYGSLATLGFFASLGLPGLCGFIGEAWVLLGAFEAADKFDWAMTAAVLAAFGVVLTAGYILWTIQRVFLGKARDDLAEMPQADRREILILAPLAVLCLLLGILPKQMLFDYMNPTLGHLVTLLKDPAASIASAAGF